MIYLSFDPMEMKHKKITYIRHYVPWPKILDNMPDMNKSLVDEKYIFM